MTNMEEHTLPATLGEAAPTTKQAGWTREQVDLLKRTYAAGATDDELKLFEYQCTRSKLDPFKKQIHFMKRAGKVVFVTAIDGYRSTADATGLYAGSDDYRYDEGLTEYGHIQKKRPGPTTATATVYKMVGGQRVGFSATARWEEYYPGKAQGWAWDKMPYLMLGKCAEALALRKAFPSELGGMYTTEEMAQAQAAPANKPAADPFVQGGKRPGKNSLADPEEIREDEAGNLYPPPTVVETVDAVDGELFEGEPPADNEDTFTVLVMNGYPIRGTLGKEYGFDFQAPGAPAKSWSRGGLLFGEATSVYDALAPLCEEKRVDISIVNEQTKVTVL